MCIFSDYCVEGKKCNKGYECKVCDRNRRPPMIENSLTDKMIIGGTDPGTLHKLREPRKLLAEIERLNAALAEAQRNQHHENCDTHDPVITGKPCNCYILYKATLEDRNKELTAATRIVENQEAQIMRLAQEKEQAEARVKEVQADNIKKAEYIVAISMTCPDEYLASKIVQEAIEKTRNRYADLESRLAHERQISDDVVRDNEILKGRIAELEALEETQRKKKEFYHEESARLTVEKADKDAYCMELQERLERRAEAVVKLQDALSDIVALADREHHEKYKEDVDVEALLPDILIIAKGAQGE